MSNPMQEIRVEKVVVNIGVGDSGDNLDNAEELLSNLTNKKPVRTKAKKRNPLFKLRQGMPIGVKVTIRGKESLEFISKALIANKKIMYSRNFDNTGNFSFGVKEYIDFPGAKYDPGIGMFGFDVCVALTRRGERVKDRRRKRGKIGNAHKITRDEAMKFAEEKLGAKIER